MLQLLLPVLPADAAPLLRRDIAEATDADPALLPEALARNVWRGEAPEGAADDLASAVRELKARIEATPAKALLAGDIA